MVDLLLNFLCQILFTVGVIICFGLLIALCRRAFCAIAGRGGATILLATGFVGTPIHELSHALMCVIFGHKITEIKLFSPKATDGVLGYVNHSYNPKNLYHQIGNFFIGIAPILCGSGVLVLLMFLLVPNVFHQIIFELQAVNGANSLDFVTLLGFFWKSITAIFDAANLSNALWWVFLVLAIMISSHMELSGADIKGGIKGCLFLVGLLLVVDIIIYLISPTFLNIMTTSITSFSLTIAGFLALSIIFLLSMLLIAFFIRAGKKVVLKR